MWLDYGCDHGMDVTKAWMWLGVMDVTEAWMWLDYGGDQWILLESWRAGPSRRLQDFV